MSNLPYISIIIPLYNRKNLISYTLQSITSSKHSGVDIEIIVVDDHSTDGGLQHVRENFPFVKTFYNNSKGACYARNLGLEKASGEFILYLDSDDIISEDFFYQKVQKLKSKSELAAVFGPWEHFNSDGEFSKEKIIPRRSKYPLNEGASWELHLNRLLGGWFIPPHAILWRKEILQKVNGHNTSLIINQDVDLLFRVLNERNLIEGIDSPVAYIREHNLTDRTGKLNGDINKLNQILHLRKFFYNEIKKNLNINKELSSSLSQYCFSFFTITYSDNPTLAEEFYQLAYQLNPQLKVSGGPFYQLLGALFGAKRAYILKHKVRKFIKV